MRKEKEIFTFHRYKKKQGGKNKRHPKLIVDYYNGEYGHMGLTEEKFKGKHHRNIPLIKNPKIGDARPAYLRKKIEYDTEDMFVEQVLDKYKLSEEDKKYLISYINQHKKR